MFRKIVCMLSAAGVFLALCIPAYAAHGFGSVRVVPDCAGNRVIGGEVAIYHIGEPAAGGYRSLDGGSDQVIGEKEIFTDSFLNWSQAQQWNNSRICEISDENGALFENLEEGLYLVIQTKAASGYSLFAPFLLTLPVAEIMDITVNPEVVMLMESPKTGDYPSPIFAAMLLSFAAVILMILTENRKK